MRILIIGHFGGRNIGDEIILLSQMQMLTKKFRTCEFIIYTYDKKFTIETYKDYNFKIETIKAFGLKNSFSSSVEQLKKIKNIDFTILGGGGIMQDTYFSYGIFRYLLPVYISLLRGIPFYTYAIGVNKFNYLLNNSIFNFALNYSNGISVRDKISYQNIKSLNSNINLTEILDSALLFNTVSLEGNVENDNLTLIFRDFFEPYLEKITILITRLKNIYNFNKINLIVFENNEIEIKLANKMKYILDNDYIVKIYNDINPINYLSILNKSSIVLTGRLHGLIPSILLKKHIVCMSYAPKIESFCDKNHIAYLKFNDLNNINNIEISDYIFDSSKINILDSKSLKNTHSFLEKIKKTFKLKPKISIFKKYYISLKLISYGFCLIIVHIFNKLLNKKANQE